MTINLDRMLKAVTPEIIDAVNNNGLHKLASNVPGISELDIGKVASYLGAKIIKQQKEFDEIKEGLTVLSSLR